MVEQAIFDENVIDGEFSKSQSESTVGGHGHLVQQILETKKELDGDSSKVEIVRSIFIILYMTVI